MVSAFVGRTVELGLLHTRLAHVTASGEGLAVALRGRRQVGKSRLVQEFCDDADAPYLYFTATKGLSPADTVRAFLSELAESALPADPELVPQNGVAGWPDVFRALASVLPESPAIVVIDEMPWLAEQDPVFEGALQAAWDRRLSRRPVLLLLLGSDLHMMERLTAYDRPFYGRADNITLGPLNLAETGRALGLEPADAIDAHLVSGGLPGILQRWPHGTPAIPFVESACTDPSAPVFTVPESTLQAEFPMPNQAHRVFETVGSGNRTHATIAARAGSGHVAVPSGTLSPLLRRLVAHKRVLAIDEPLSTRADRPALYRVADSNLRLYLGILRAAQDLARRGRSGGAVTLVRRRWAAWRGRAVEPLVREALELAALDGVLPWPLVEAVGGWWNRRFDPELDLVGADRAPIAGQVYFAGSVKWLATPFGAPDLAALRRDAAQVPGFTPGKSGLVVVSLAGVSAGLDFADVNLKWGPNEVIAAWAGTDG